MSSSFRRLLGWALSLGLLGWLALRIEFQSFWEALSGVSFFDLGILAAIYLTGFLFRGLRSQVLLPELNFELALGGVVVGYAANNLLPARLGEVVRAQLVGIRAGLSRAMVFSNVIVERILDGLAIVTLLFIGSSTLQLPPWADQIANIGAVIFGTAFIGVALLGPTEKIWSRFIPAGRIGEILHSFADGIKAAARKPSQLVQVMAYSVLIWFIEAVMFWYAGEVFGFGFGLLSAMFVLGVVNLGVLIPSSPGNVGVFQYFAVLSLGAIGVGESPATAYALTVHACQYLPIVIIGLLWLPHFGFKSFTQLRGAASPSALAGQSRPELAK